MIEMDEYLMIREVKIKFEERNRVIRGTYNNLPVYRHRDYEDSILPGRTYICDLTINYSTMGNYFAIPLEEVEEPKCQQSIIEEMRPLEEPIVGVLRISPTELKSNLFTDEGYQVKIAPDCRSIIISPFSRSSLRCKDGVLTIVGLDKLVPFDGLCGYTYSLSGNNINSGTDTYLSSKAYCNSSCYCFAWRSNVYFPGRIYYRAVPANTRLCEIGEPC